MIVWLLLLLGMVVMSFLLARRSMRDYQETPEKNRDYGLFLIRKPQELSVDVFKSGQLISFERLFKGNKSTLVIFGPKEILATLKSLDLLELEDYTNVNIGHISAWEVGIKSRVEKGIFTGMSILLEHEHFWWQVVISKSFKPQIRAVVVSAEKGRREALTQTLGKMASGKLYRLPKAFSDRELLDFYKQRSYKIENKNPKLSPEEILNLIRI